MFRVERSRRFTTHWSRKRPLPHCHIAAGKRPLDQPTTCLQKERR